MAILYKLIFMITRIVKLTIKEENRDDFRNIFALNNKHIGNFTGCKEVKLVESNLNDGVFFTLSTWDSQESIDLYRKSELFGTIWPKVKTWFSDKPEAWSTTQIKNI